VSNAEQTSRQIRHSRGQRPRRPTPRPSPDPLPVRPRIHVSPPVVPSPLVTQPIPTRQTRCQFLQPLVRTPRPPCSGPSSGDEIVFVPGAENTPLLCYYPETFFIATTLPTRTFTELHLFKEHCRNIYNNHHQPVKLQQLFNRISEYTNTPLAFTQFLWRVKTHIDGRSITETYCWIKKRSWAGTPDSAYLEPAYRVFHPWTGSEWITTSISNLL
jgi:hypothetical protein